jgi:hypothetical protein
LRFDIDLDADLKFGGFEYRTARSLGEVRRVCDETLCGPHRSGAAAEALVIREKVTDLARK